MPLELCRHALQMCLLGLIVRRPDLSTVGLLSAFRVSYFVLSTSDTKFSASNLHPELIACELKFFRSKFN